MAEEGSPNLQVPAETLLLYSFPGLFVITSWASFLIPPEVVPGRMAMLITLFLVLINIFNSVTSVSPNVEGMTAISAWMIVCILFVFAALAGYAYLVRGGQRVLAHKLLCD